MNEDVFRKWLESYLRPQEQQSAEKIKELFAENGVYWWGPYNPPRSGASAVYEHHRNALSHQRDIKYDYTILAVTPTHGIAHFHLTLNDLNRDEPKEYDGIFLVYLDRENKCTLFQEWYHVPGR